MLIAILAWVGAGMGGMARADCKVSQDTRALVGLMGALMRSGRPPEPVELIWLEKLVAVWDPTDRRSRLASLDAASKSDAVMHLVSVAGRVAAEGGIQDRYEFEDAVHRAERFVDRVCAHRSAGGEAAREPSGEPSFGLSALAEFLRSGSDYWDPTRAVRIGSLLIVLSGMISAAYLIRTVFVLTQAMRSEWRSCAIRAELKSGEMRQTGIVTMLGGSGFRFVPEDAGDFRPFEALESDESVTLAVQGKELRARLKKRVAASVTLRFEMPLTRATLSGLLARSLIPPRPVPRKLNLTQRFRRLVEALEA